jgi:hypothetical protein
MQTADWLSLLLLGVFGTGHCIGMCGPLIVAFPGQRRRFHAHLLYHLGRIGVYTIIGGALGGTGLLLAAIAADDPVHRVQVLGRIQVLLSLVAGGGLIFMALAQLGLLNPVDGLTVARPEGLPWLGKLIAITRRWPASMGMLGLGAVNGLLPCGLSYAAFIRAAGADGVMAGMAMCLAFGLGTLPGLLLLGTGAAAIIRRFHRQAGILSGLVMALMGTMLLVKGLGVLFTG